MLFLVFLLTPLSRASFCYEMPPHNAPDLPQLFLHSHYDSSIETTSFPSMDHCWLFLKRNDSSWRSWVFLFYLYPSYNLWTPPSQSYRSSTVILVSKQWTLHSIIDSMKQSSSWLVFINGSSILRDALPPFSVPKLQLLTTPSKFSRSSGAILVSEQRIFIHSISQLAIFKMNQNRISIFPFLHNGSISNLSWPTQYSKWWFA